MIRGAPIFTAIPLLALISCAREDLVAELTGSTDAGSREDASSPDDAGEEICGQGPPIIVGDSGDTCGSAVAERTFHFAICSCTEVVANNRITTDAFDSTLGPYTAGGPGGSIGVNAGLNTSAPIFAGGSLWVGGATGISAGRTAELRAGVELACAGPLASSAPVTIAGDARVNGRVGASTLDVGGTLTVPEGAVIDVPGASNIGALARAPVAVGAPCACAAEELVDIAAYVARHRTDNDNAAAGIAADALENVSTARVLELGCGRYYFTRIGAHAALRIFVAGRASILVDGDLSVDQRLEVELGAGSEIDLFVAGNVVSAGPLSFGSFRTPARARLYAGGSGTIQLSGGGTFAGNMYAPRAELVASAPVEVFGSIFVRRLAISAELTVHYDTAVLHAGDDCDAPPPATCSTCVDCPNVACTAGQCTTCTATAECCPPLFCIRGRCEAPSL